MWLSAILERLKLGFRGVAATAPAPITVARAPGPIPAGPVSGSKLTPDFVREVGRLAYLWGWPLVNIYNRHWTQSWVKTQTFLVGGVAPVAPINHLGMLVGYNEPGQRFITCPSQDLIYGFGILDLSREPVIVQVPDFGKRFFVFQVTDQRTDAYGEMGSMYGTRPGFYLLVGPDWKGAASRRGHGCVPRIDQSRLHHSARVPG